MKTKESEVQGLPRPHSVLETRMECMRPVSEKKVLVEHGTFRQEDQGHAQLH